MHLLNQRVAGTDETTRLSNTLLATRHNTLVFQLTKLSNAWFICRFTVKIIIKSQFFFFPKVLKFRFLFNLKKAWNTQKLSHHTDLLYKEGISQPQETSGTYPNCLWEQVTERSPEAPLAVHKAGSSWKVKTKCTFIIWLQRETLTRERWIKPIMFFN